MKIIIIGTLPVLVVSFMFGMISLSYPVRKKGDILIIGYPIFRKKYNLQNVTVDCLVEFFKSLRGHSYNVVIYVYQDEGETLIGKHILQGYMRRKRAEKDLEKVKRIIYPEKAELEEVI